MYWFFWHFFHETKSQIKHCLIIDYIHLPYLFSSHNISFASILSSPRITILKSANMQLLSRHVFLFHSNTQNKSKCLCYLPVWMMWCCCRWVICLNARLQIWHTYFLSPESNAGYEEMSNYFSKIIEKKGIYRCPFS